MPRPDLLRPVTMARVAVLAPEPALRELLVRVAELGCLDVTGGPPPADAPAPPGSARDRLQHVSGAVAGAGRRVARAAPDLDRCQREGRVELLAGEAELERRAEAAARSGRACGLTGWVPRVRLAELAEHVAPVGGAVAELAPPAGVDPPTLLSQAAPARPFRALVTTYQTVPYADVDPTLLAGAAYVVMFGMMFGDVGHGLLLVAGGLFLRTGRPEAVVKLSHLAPFVIGGGISATLFGLMYGEAFGPTQAVPTLWLSPLDHPTTLLSVAIAAGACLLAVAYALGTFNRWREGGAARAAVAMSGLAGLLVYLGIGLLGLGVYEDSTVALVVGGVAAGTGLLFGALGSYVEAGGAIQAAIELFDSLIRIGTNTVSFARLAAFGLTHAALGMVVWSATTGLWHRGGVFLVGSAIVFLAGNAVSFALEGLVAGVQALRLEYYELFSRVFVLEGLPFQPWRGGPERSGALPLSDVSKEDRP